MNFFPGMTPTPKGTLDTQFLFSFVFCVYVCLSYFPHCDKNTMHGQGGLQRTEFIWAYNYGGGVGPMTDRRQGSKTLNHQKPHKSKE